MLKFNFISNCIFMKDYYYFLIMLTIKLSLIIIIYPESFENIYEF